METTILKDGVNYSFYKTSRFKTTVLSIGFYLPLGSLNAATSLALGLMKSGTANLPDLYSFNRRLATLYGATVSSWTSKVGDQKELRLNLTVNSDRFSLDGESTVNGAAELFLDMVFSREKSGFSYPKDVFDREKRLLIEKIEGTLNDKRVYSKLKLEAAMCEGEPYGTCVNGTKEEVSELTPAIVADSFKTLLESAFISVTVIGDKEPDNFKDILKSKFNALGRKFLGVTSNTLKPARQNALEVTEEMNVTQGKLVLGFRSAVGGNSRDTVAVRVMTAVFGGGPFSKLFLNVREKQSLCYYCAARGIRQKGLILVDSGVETENIEKAKTAILKQFKDMQDGNFTEDDLNFAKLAICDALRSAESDQYALLTWISGNALENDPPTIEETCRLIENVISDDVKKSAKLFSLDTVFTLNPKKEEK